MNIQGQFILTEHDKQLHFGAGMITSALGYTWSYNKHQNKKRAMITGLCTAFAAGVAKELFDGGVMGGYVDHRDILATTMGGITMSVTIPLFQPKKRRYRKLDKWNGGYDYDDIPYGDPTIEQIMKNKDGTFMDVRQEERNNLILIIQLIVGVSIASACAIAILILGLFFLNSKLGI